ncbi:uncharacterized protein HMPREF1541_07987 [Cyphellophora europaea CBS 101466]|uniref:RGS domain-containing protein n=1 Tax=Cyphellophora europaea (strain CBS 101466) TaxID=1220924 RepID=W2RMQ1_CYPE1|nr:uncharacterized protein HMPREF1541_07987 [Cyphellophora europaea CBS 101466]ETN36999.1 hypothetical protein HMPREF1541_07987 [Cyphellophora europaea CBS 101466]
MESPVVPMSRMRLTKDYTLTDDDDDDAPPPIKRYREGKPQGLPMGYDTDAIYNSPPRINGHRVRSDSREGARSSALRARGPERSLSQTSDNMANNKPYQDHSSEHQYTAQEQDELRKLDFNLEPIDERYNVRQDERHNDAASVTSSHMTDTRSAAPSGSSVSRLPDFFSDEVLQIVLHNPITSRQLLKFSRKRLCAENMEFLSAVDRYQSLLNDVAKTLFDVHKSFLSPQAPSQINIPEHIMNKVNKDLKTSLSTTLPKLETVFTDSQNDVETLVATDIYPRFVRHQMTMSATRALAGDKAKYAGLGDCFVLTDPSKADNPITFASDGFVSVTGYTRNEIIPRNCRFLQGKHTDRKAVRRLGDAIDAREESVELLLNERKNGEPFWNLLYVTPLRDARGNVVFFLGGQINCSTTIHSQNDILRILALNEDVEEDTAPRAPAQEKPNSRYSRFFPSFKGSRSNGVVAKPSPGMEDGLLGKIEKLNLREQMDSFYTAYSKFLVVNAATSVIAFHSAGISSLLWLPGTTATYQPSQPVPVGQNVFNFLGVHAPGGSLPSGFKSKAKAAFKEGKAVSLETQLCTTRHRGFERFVVHFTPLKGGNIDGKEEVGWVVISFGGGGD